MFYRLTLFQQRPMQKIFTIDTLLRPRTIHLTTTVFELVGYAKVQQWNWQDEDRAAELLKHSVGTLLGLIRTQGKKEIIK